MGAVKVKDRWEWTCEVSDELGEFAVGLYISKKDGIALLSLGWVAVGFSRRTVLR